MPKPLNQHERRQAIKDRLKASSGHHDPEELANEFGVSARTIFRDLAALGHKTRSSPPKTSVLVGHDLPLVGRTDELQILNDLWANIANGQGRIALVTAVAGGGKTRLTEEFITQLPGASPNIARFRWPDLTGSTSMPTMMDALAADLRSPPLENSISPEGPSSGSAGDRPVYTSPFAYYGAAIGWLAENSREHPLLIILDDFQNADAASMEFVLALADRLTDMRIMVVISSRLTFTKHHFEPGEYFANLTRTPGTAHIELNPLESDNLRSLVEAVIGRSPSDDEMHEVLENTGGNPLLAFEYSKLLATDSSISSTSHLDDIIVERFRRANPTMKTLLARAAITGRAFSPDTLTKLNPEGDLSVTPGMLDKAEREGIIRRTGTSGVEYEFVHALFADYFYRNLSIAESQNIHARLAADIAQSPDNQRDSVLLAHHRHEAGDQVSAADRVEAYTDAGWQLIDDHDFFGAHTSFELANDLKTESSKELAARITYGLAFSSLATNPLGDLGATHSLLIDAFDRYLTLGDTETALSIALIPLITRGGLDQRQLELCSRGLEIAGDDSLEQALLHSRIGRALAVCTGEWEAALVEFGAAERIINSSGTTSAEVALLVDWLEAAGWADERDLIERLALRCLETNKAVQSVSADYQANWSLAELGLLQSQPAEALPRAYACLRAGEKIPSKTLLVGALVTIANCLIDLGRISEAKEHLERAITLDPSDSRPVQNKVKALAVGGLKNEAELLIIELRQMADSDPPGPTNTRRQFILACSYVASINSEFNYSNDVGNVVRQMNITKESPAISKSISELGTALSAAHSTSNEPAAEVLAAHPDIADHPSISPLLHGMLLHKAGDTESAIEVTEKYIVKMEQNSSLSNELAGHAQLVELLADRELSQAPHKTRIDEIERQTELKLPRRLSTSLETISQGKVDLSALSRRELEVLALISTGSSNREIADELFVTTNTVQTHVSNIFAKLNIGNRAEAAALGAIAGLTTIPSPTQAEG